MNPSEYESILRPEFEASEGSFLLQLRCGLTWDKIAFSRLVSAMEVCASSLADAATLPRWIAEGFWFCHHFVQDWSTHPNFPREHTPEYYRAAYERLRDLAFWLFIGQSPSTRPLPQL